MGEMSMHAGGAMSMWTRMPGQTWPGFAASFLWMWVTMMVPMMIPPFAAMMWRYRQAAISSGITPLGALTGIVGLGYFCVWSAIGVAILPLIGGFSAIGATPAVGGTIALLAAILQQAGAITLCQDSADGKVGGIGTAWRYGARLALDCSRSCAPLMVIALVASGTNFPVMSAITAGITAERLLGWPMSTSET